MRVLLFKVMSAFLYYRCNSTSALRILIRCSQLRNAQCVSQPVYPHSLISQTVIQIHEITHEYLLQ